MTPWRNVTETPEASLHVLCQRGDESVLTGKFDFFRCSFTARKRAGQFSTKVSRPTPGGNRNPDCGYENKIRAWKDGCFNVNCEPLNTCQYSRSRWDLIRNWTRAHAEHARCRPPGSVDPGHPDQPFPDCRTLRQRLLSHALPRLQLECNARHRC